MKTAGPLSLQKFTGSILPCVFQLLMPPDIFLVWSALTPISASISHGSLLRLPSLLRTLVIAFMAYSNPG